MRANAAAVARFLAGRDDVAWRSLPGWRGGHPQVALPRARCARAAAWSRSCRAGGGRRRERAVAICEATRLFTLAESLGGVESLIEVPAAMTHLSVAGSPLEVDPALVRLSVGHRRPAPT